MQNQFLTEDTAQTTYTAPAVAQAELATTETTAETQDAQTTQAVHQWLAGIQRKTRRDKVKFWTLFILFESFCLSEVFGFSLMHYLRTYLSGPIAFALLFLPMLIAGALGLRFLLRTPHWNAEELMRIGGIQAVGTIIELVTAPGLRHSRTPLYAALIELLPQMKASDARLLTTGQRRSLHRLLTIPFQGNVDADTLLRLRLAVLKALEQVGDASAIPVVSRLANGRAVTANQKMLKAAAQECLPLLQANYGEVEANKTLLRASAPEDNAPETLLRPAAFTPDAAPKELLRASDAAPLPPSAS